MLFKVFPNQINIYCKLSEFCCSVNDGNEKWQIMNAVKKTHSI